mgnify:CR=1 FL=1
MSTTKRRLLAAAATALVALSAMAAHADYPDRAITITVGFAPGGTSDIVARAVSQKLNEAGYTTVVENRPGANGSIAGEALAKSPNDGYTLLVGSIGTFAINMGLYKNAKYDVLRDFDAITVAVRTPNILIVPPNFPANNLKEFIEYAASISFSFLTGMLLGAMAYRRTHRRTSAAPSPLLRAVVGHLSEGKLSGESVQQLITKLEGIGGTAVAIGTTAMSVYTGLKSLM